MSLLQAFTSDEASALLGGLVSGEGDGVGVGVGVGVGLGVGIGLGVGVGRLGREASSPPKSGPPASALDREQTEELSGKLIAHEAES